MIKELWLLSLCNTIYDWTGAVYDEFCWMVILQIKTADDIDDINYRFKTYVCQGLSPLALVTHTHTHTAL